MLQLLGWVLIGVLCGAAGGETAVQAIDARLQEARAAFDEAGKLKDAGEYAKARARAEHALTLREAVLGGSHTAVADCLNLLGEVHWRQGELTPAESFYQRALVLREAALGQNHPDVAQSLIGLANIYRNQGAYAQAEKLFLRGLAIREEALGGRHPDVAASLNNLAILYYRQGLYDRAEPLFQRALAMREAIFGKNHPDVANSLGNLAALYKDQGLYDRAEPLLLRALTLVESAFGKNHPAVANSLDNLAALYKDQGLYDRAEPLYQRALGIKQASFGENHHNLAASLNQLAWLRLAQQRLADALPLYSRAFSLSEQRLSQESLDFSEARLARFLQHVRAEEDTLYALLRAHPEDPRVQRLAISAVLVRKGRSVAETAAISRTIYQRLGSEDRVTFERLRGLRTQLAALSFAGPRLLPPAVYQQRLQSLADEGDLLEADLAKRSAALRALTAQPPPDSIVEHVAAALPKEGALIEFVAYADRPLVPEPGTPRAKIASQLRYLALVLFPNASIRAVDLGPVAPIDRTASRLRNVLAKKNVSVEPVARDLYQRAFHPLRRLLGSTRRIWLSPDSQLNLIPFSALHDGQRFLVDAFDFTYLTSGRELLPRPEAPTPSPTVVVLAVPDFKAPLHSEPSTSELPPAPRPNALERFFSTGYSDLPRSHWRPLPGTRTEAQDIQRLWPQAQLFLGADATKERLLHLPTPGILHLATHGFFLGKASSSSGGRGVVSFGSPGGLPKPQQEPLLNSGLVLAGVRATDSGSASPSMDATLVTALELAGINLWGTQLVVLSACDTGRGDVHLGQGVYGLRRALVVAGAETVVMSLWTVKDDSTSALMRTYYRNLLAGQGRSTALREAMRSFKKSHPHPYDWAPFIALGSDEPLQSIIPSAPRTP